MGAYNLYSLFANIRLSYIAMWKILGVNSVYFCNLHMIMDTSAKNLCSTLKILAFKIFRLHGA